MLGISQLNKEIASVGELIKTAKKTAKTGSKNLDIKNIEEDAEIYSSKHYIYGELIVKCWRDFQRVKHQEFLELAEREKQEAGKADDAESAGRENVA